MVTPSYTWRLATHAYDLDADGHVPAEEVTYDNATSGLTATDAQAAIDEIAAAGGSGTPTGPAGGDLSGTYPNPSVVDDSHSHTAATLPASTGGQIVMEDGTSSPPLPLWTEDGTDYLYSD